MVKINASSQNIFFIIGIIVILVVGFYFLVITPGSAPSQTGKQSTDTQTVQINSELLEASQELNNTDIDEAIDPDLEKNSAAAQSF